MEMGAEGFGVGRVALPLLTEVATPSCRQTSLQTQTGGGHTFFCSYVQQQRRTRFSTFFGASVPFTRVVVMFKSASIKCIIEKL